MHGRKNTVGLLLLLGAFALATADDTLTVLAPSAAPSAEGPRSEVWTFDATLVNGSEGPRGEVWTFDASADGGEAIPEGLASAEDDLTAAQNADGWWSSQATGDGAQMSEGEMDDAVESWWGRSSPRSASPAATLDEGDSDADSWWGNKQASGDAAKFMDGELDAEESEALQAVLSENEEMDGALRAQPSAKQNGAQQNAAQSTNAKKIQKLKKKIKKYQRKLAKLQRRMKKYQNKIKKWQSQLKKAQQGNSPQTPKPSGNPSGKLRK